jgi:hypothetical protein
MHAFSQVISSILEYHHVDYMGTENTHTEAVRGSKSSKKRLGLLIKLRIHIYRLSPIHHRTLTIPVKSSPNAPAKLAADIPQIRVE